MPRLRVVLFDLDGTLVDSAPDLAGTANDMRADRGLAPRPLGELRPHAGSGARGMLYSAFDLRPGDPGYESMRTEFLQRYAQRLLVLSRAFDNSLRLLEDLGGRDTPWGIVTNKALNLAQPLVSALLPAPAVLVGGDCTPHLKPHPGPLLEAARRLGVDPRACAYVGDDARDIAAARAAGMAALAAAWGYISERTDLRGWSADAVLASPLELLNWLDMA